MNNLTRVCAYRRVAVITARPFGVLLFIALSLIGVSFIAQGAMDKESSQGESANGGVILNADISPDMNPHWDKEKCHVCHASEPKKGQPALRGNDVMGMCRECHEDDITHKYIHPAAIKIPNSYKSRIESRWKKGVRLDKENRLICSTCHDMHNQCLPERSYMARLNPRFLRDGPYKNRTEVCYKCHDDTKYKKLVAHEQIADDDTLMINKCRLCHEIKGGKKIKRGIKKDRDKYPLIKNLESERLMLCIRCHKKFDHPTSALHVRSMNKYRHFIKITEEKKKVLNKMKSETGIYMPLEPGTDRIYCGTCHEAHQPGVFAGEKKRISPKAKKRLRAEKICAYCHDK